MTELESKQFAFSRYLAELLYSLTDSGYQVSIGEIWRPPEMAKLYAAEGKGICNSDHTLRLAADLNLWKDGKLLTDPSDYKTMGDRWTANNLYQHKTNYEFCWGGRFTKIDADHISIAHNGVR